MEPIDLLHAFLAADELAERLTAAGRFPGRWAAGPIFEELAEKARRQARELLDLSVAPGPPGLANRRRLRVARRLMELGSRLRRGELLAHLEAREGVRLTRLQGSAVEALLASANDMAWPVLPPPGSTRSAGGFGDSPPRVPLGRSAAGLRRGSGEIRH